MREKLIELIGQVQDEGRDYSDVVCVYPTSNKRLADHLIANGVTILKWIPVTERLPERSGFYLVCTVHEFYKTAKMAKAHFRSGGFYGQGGHWSNVTHWMPLPELPKEVE